MEGIVNKAVKKRVTKDKTVFNKGRQESLQGIVTAFANLILVLDFLAGTDEPNEFPGILQMLHKIAGKIKKQTSGTSTTSTDMKCNGFLITYCAISSWC